MNLWTGTSKDVKYEDLNATKQNEEARTLYGPINEWDVSNVTNMQVYFNQKKNLTMIYLLECQ